MSDDTPLWLIEWTIRKDSGTICVETIEELIRNSEIEDWEKQC